MDTFWCPGCDKRIDTDLVSADRSPIVVDRPPPLTISKITNPYSLFRTSRICIAPWSARSRMPTLKPIQAHHPTHPLPFLNCHLVNSGSSSDPNRCVNNIVLLIHGSLSIDDVLWYHDAQLLQQALQLQLRVFSVVSLLLLLLLFHNSSINSMAYWHKLHSLFPSLHLSIHPSLFHISKIPEKH